MNDNYDDMFPEGHAFRGMSPKDGLSTMLDVGTKTVALYIVHRRGGELAKVASALCASSSVKAAQYPLTSDGMGHCNRLKMLLDAIARYINTGGSCVELTGVVGDVKALMAPVNELPLPGFAYRESIPLDGGHYQHIFVKDDSPEGEAVVWEEPNPEGFGGLFDLTTVGELQSQDTESDE